MLNHIWGVLCQEIIVDQKTNAVTYINSIEEIGSTNFPARIPNLKLGLMLLTDPIEVFRIRVSVMNPDDASKVLIETEDYKFNTKRNRINFIFDQLGFDKPGTYYFVVEYKTDHKWERAQVIPLDIKTIDKK